MKIFTDDEAGYLAWIKANPHGWVANIDKAGQIPNYPLAHRASHALLSSPSRTNYTTAQYFKACAADVAELEVWSASKYGRQLSWCGTCARHKLSGEAVSDAVVSDAWTDQEMRSSVAAYLDMREKQRAGQSIVKKHYYEALAEQYGRTAKAFEFRMQNISHVLELMGRPWIPGLVPARNVGATNAARIESLVAEIEGQQVLPVAALAVQTREAAKKLKGKPAGNAKPAGVTVSVTQYVRDPAVKAWVLRKAKGVCECCMQPAPFETADGPFLEVHHVRLLAEQGSDTVCNAVAICPNCHRRLHYGLDASTFILRLYQRIARLRPLQPTHVAEAS